MIHIVLYHPEIPQNTGNIMRTCVAAGAFLDIIGPLPFDLSEKALRRAGMDYIDDLKWRYYDSLAAFEAVHPDVCMIYVTRYADKRYDRYDLHDPIPDLFVMFGRESTGIPHDILRAHPDRCARIPMVPSARSLNLSNAVAIVLYEILRQQGFPGLATQEALKGPDFLDKETHPL